MNDCPILLLESYRNTCSGLKIDSSWCDSAILNQVCWIFKHFNWRSLFRNAYLCRIIRSVPHYHTFFREIWYASQLRSYWNNVISFPSMHITLTLRQLSTIKLICNRPTESKGSRWSKSTIFVTGKLQSILILYEERYLRKLSQQMFNLQFVEALSLDEMPWQFCRRIASWKWLYMIRFQLHKRVHCVKMYFPYRLFHFWLASESKEFIDINI